MANDDRRRMQGALLSTLAGPGTLLNKKTVRDCMKDPGLRLFLGHALLHEIMPSMGKGREELDPVAMAVCAEMESPAVEEPLALVLSNALRGWEEQALPLVRAYQEREEKTPPCLCMGLSALIMLYAGARKTDGGRYAYLRDGEEIYLSDDEDALYSFSRLSCDMPPETLSYAVLSDRAVWTEDLREVPGLEARIEGQLKDIQLLGLQEAVQRAWQESKAD